MHDWIQSEKLTDDHLAQYNEQGYLILDGYMKQPYIDTLWAALTKTLPTFEQLKDADGELGGKRSLLRPFPFTENELNVALTDPELMKFARRALDTEDVVYNGSNLVGRYPGATVGSSQGWHIDNNNNSLLPQADGDQRFGQIVFWLFPDGVRDGDGHMLLLAREHGEDFDKAVKVTGKGGTLAIFNNYTWHTGTDFKNPDGQRLSWGGIYGRADHPWEGLLPYTQKGRHPDFVKLISSISAKDRELFRFPPVGHPYYTPKTLERLEAQYPGFNANNEYASPVTA